jgi:hypothetical protein
MPLACAPGLADRLRHVDCLLGSSLPKKLSILASQP